MNNTPLEKTREEYFVGKIESLGGWCLKFWPTTFTGFPDRITLISGKLYLVELKREKSGVLSKRQIWVHKKLNEMGFTVYIVHTLESARELIKKITSDIQAL